jgi:hypothetical protein
LSQQSSTQYLEDLGPDLIIIDEAQGFAHRSSARVKRLIGYSKRNRACRIIVMSGTLTDRKISDYDHLAWMALRDGCFLPSNGRLFGSWSAVLNAAGEPDAISYRELLQCIPGGTMGDQTECRRAYARRMLSTPGVVGTHGLSVDVPLTLRCMPTPPSPDMAVALRQLEAKWEDPDGLPICNALDYRRVGMGLSMGYYTRIDWPRGVDDEWLVARRVWAAALRAQVQYRSQRGLDSLGLVERAVADGYLPHLRRAYDAWQAVRDRYGRDGPPVSDVWVDAAWLPACIAEWRHSHGLIWYYSVAVGATLARMGIPAHGAGSEAPTASLAAASIRCHGTGKNLQQYTRHLVLQPSSSGKVWEQLLGRAHRMGQTRSVQYDVLTHTPTHRKAVFDAVRNADYIERTTQAPQRITRALEAGRTRPH